MRVSKIEHVQRPLNRERLYLSPVIGMGLIIHSSIRELIPVFTEQLPGARRCFMCWRYKEEGTNKTKFLPWPQISKNASTFIVCQKEIKKHGEVEISTRRRVGADCLSTNFPFKVFHNSRACNGEQKWTEMPLEYTIKCLYLYTARSRMIWLRFSSSFKEKSSLRNNSFGGKKQRWCI